MILHIADDEAFIDVAIDQFEEIAPNQSIYLINIPDKNYKIKHIKRLDKILLLQSNSTEYKTIINGKYDAILFHNLNKYKLRIINSLPKNNYIHWFSWGFDIYSVPKLKRKLLLPKTKDAAYSHGLITVKQKISLFSPFLWNLINLFVNGNYSTYYMLKRAAIKINSISTIVDNEYDLITKHINKNIVYLPYKYGSIDYIFKNIDQNIICTKNDILVGNSASLSSNHIDAFELIKTHHIKQEIFVPLSYGNKKYANIVSEKGKVLFGDSFHPIYNLLPLPEYIRLLQSCGTVIMNHLRQQAMGNIIISLYLGAKIYMQPTNPSYIFLRNKNIQLYDINSFNYDADIASKDLAAYNRPVLYSIYGKENVLKLTENLYMFFCTSKLSV